MSKKRTPHVVNGVADIRDAVEMFAAEKCLYAAPCMRWGCVFHAWCHKGSRKEPSDLSWILRAERRHRKLARDRARRAGR